MDEIATIEKQWNETLLRVVSRYANHLKVKLKTLNPIQAPGYLEAITLKALAKKSPPQMIILNGASGSGKGAVGKELIKRGVVFLPRITTRAMRPGEVQGQDYFFVTKAEFDQMIRRNELVVWAETFGEYRGTSTQLLKRFRDSGKSFFVEGSTKAYIEFINHPEVMKTRFIAVEILPPSFPILIERLKIRPDEIPESEFLERLKKAVEHLAQTIRYPYDLFIVNDSVERVVKIILKFLDHERT